MKPTDVTDEMADKLRREQCVDWGRKEIIAAAVNAALGDPTPITAEWLVKNGYVNSELAPAIYKKLIGKYVVYFETDKQRLTVHKSFSWIDFSHVKTIGQLRALEIGLGITPCL